MLDLVSLVVALGVATLALCVAWLVRDARRERANAVMHEKIRLYLRQQLTAQE
jgi:hypothetical protein